MVDLDMWISWEKTGQESTRRGSAGAESTPKSSMKTNLGIPWNINMAIPIVSMYAIYGNMDPINIPQMLAYIPYMDPMR